MYLGNEYLEMQEKKRQKYLTLCKNIRLNVSVIVFAGPDEGS